MIRLRTKFWFMLAGADAVLTLIFAMRHDLGFLLLSVLLTAYANYIAEMCLTEDLEQLKGDENAVRYPRT